MPTRWRWLLVYALTCYICMAAFSIYFAIANGDSFLAWWISAPVSSVLLLASEPFATTWGWIWPVMYAVVFVLLSMAFGLVNPAERRRQRRRWAGLCVQCGYDLRASKERCPECGTPIPTSSLHPPETLDPRP